MIEVLDRSHGDTVCLRVDGGISVEELKKVESDLEQVFAAHGKVNAVHGRLRLQGVRGGFALCVQALESVLACRRGRSVGMDEAGRQGGFLSDSVGRAIFTPNQIEEAWRCAEGRA